MSKSYYLAADGGGSKLLTILYDEHLNVIRTGRVAGVNTLYKPAHVVRENILSMMDELMEGLDGSIVAADLCLIGAGHEMQEAILRYNAGCDVQYRSEPCVGLAACFKTDGAVALSGTGSDAFFVRNTERVHAVGGWGPLLGDEGSGYDIGLRTLKAAIYTYDGRGEPSALYELVKEHWGVSDLWSIVSHLAGNPEARHEVASAAKLCAKAAHEGDRIALRIYEHAALELSLQTRTVIDRHRSEWDGTVVIMGGAWKGHPRMFEIFKREMELSYPEARVMRAVYEPVVGCIVLRLLSEGRSMKDIQESLGKGFREFLYD